MKIYLDYDQEELDRQYEHRYFVPDADEILAFQAAESERVRAAATGRFDVAYGAGEDELLDIFLADGAAASNPAVRRLRRGPVVRRRLRAARHGVARPALRRHARRESCRCTGRCPARTTPQ